MEEQRRDYGYVHARVEVEKEVCVFKADAMKRPGPLLSQFKMLRTTSTSDIVPSCFGALIYSTHSNTSLFQKPVLPGEISVSFDLLTLRLLFAILNRPSERLFE